MFHRQLYENIILNKITEGRAESLTQDESFTRVDNVAYDTSIPQVANPAYNTFQLDEKNITTNSNDHLYYEVINLVDASLVQQETQNMDAYDYVDVSHLLRIDSTYELLNVNISEHKHINPMLFVNKLLFLNYQLPVHPNNL